VLRLVAALHGRLVPVHDLAVAVGLRGLELELVDVLRKRARPHREQVERFWLDLPSQVILETAWLRRIAAPNARRSPSRAWTSSPVRRSIGGEPTGNLSPSAVDYQA
jgi:hypothetical protein